MRSLGISTKLQIENARDFYVEGDVIYGEVVLAVLDTQCRVRRLWVELRCNENVRLSPQGAVLTFKVLQRTQELVEDCELRRGCHTFSYAMRVPGDNDYHYPPSLKVAELGDCGIRWYMKASAEAETSVVVDDTFDICVYRLPPSSLASPERSHGHQYRNGMHCRITTAMWIPQAPDVIDAVVVVELDDPALVCSVDVYIQGQLVVWWELDSKVIVWKHAVETVCVDAVVSRVELDGRLRKWQLKGPLPSQFSSAHTHLRYAVCVAVQVAGKSPCEFKLPNANIVTPVAQCRSDMEVPPAYTANRALQEDESDKGSVKLQISACSI